MLSADIQNVCKMHIIMYSFVREQTGNPDYYNLQFKQMFGDILIKLNYNTITL
jgi:hypothetical protein